LILQITAVFGDPLRFFYAPAGTGNYTFAGTTTSGYYMIPEIT